MAEAAKKPKRPIKLPETVAAAPEFSAQEVKKEPNPFTEPDWRMLLYAWSGMILRILLVVGAVFSAYQYLQARVEKRVEHTLAMVELWERQEYQAAQRALKRRLTDLNQRYVKDLGPTPSPTEIAIFRDRIGIEAMTEGGGAQPLAEFRDEFDRIVYFLNRLAFCVEGNLCSRPMADAYFLDFARSFWDYFGAFVRQERKRGAPSYAEAIEAYVTAKR